MVERMILATLVFAISFPCRSQVPTDPPKLPSGATDVAKVKKVKNPDRFYAKISGGVHMGTGNSFKIRNHSITNLTQSGIFTSQQTYNKKGVGRGFGVNLGAGMIVNDYINIEVSVGYHQFAKQTFTDNARIIFASQKQSNTTTDHSLEGSMFLVKPGIVLKAHFNLNFLLYGRLAFALAPKSEINYLFSNRVVDTLGATSVLESTRKYTTSMPWGFETGLGFQLSLKKRIRIFAELNYYSISSKAEKLEYTAYSVNGIDRLSTLPVRTKIVEYVDIDTNPDNPINASIPEKQVTFNVPLIAVGFHVGVAYRF